MAGIRILYNCCSTLSYSSSTWLSPYSVISGSQEKLAALWLHSVTAYYYGKVKFDPMKPFYFSSILLTMFQAQKTVVTLFPGFIRRFNQVVMHPLAAFSICFCKFLSIPKRNFAF